MQFTHGSGPCVRRAVLLPRPGISAHEKSMVNKRSGAEIHGRRGTS